MERLTILMLLVFLFLPSKVKSQQLYNLNDLLKNAIENSHEIKKAGLQQKESSSRTKEVKTDDASMAHLHLGLLPYWLVSTIGNVVSLLKVSD